MGVANEILGVQYGLLDRQVGCCCRNTENVEISWNEVRARGSKYSEGPQKAAWIFLRRLGRNMGIIVLLLTSQKEMRNVLLKIGERLFFAIV